MPRREIDTADCCNAFTQTGSTGNLRRSARAPNARCRWLRRRGGSSSPTGGSAGAIRIRTQTTGAVEDVVKQALQETIEQVTQQRVEQQRTAWERTVLIIDRFRCLEIRWQ